MASSACTVRLSSQPELQRVAWPSSLVTHLQPVCPSHSEYQHIETTRFSNPQPNIAMLQASLNMLIFVLLHTLQENNPAAMARLLAVTQHTKSSFLDRKFLRKKQQSSNLRAVRLWYVDVDTWLAGTATSAEQPGSQAGAAKSGKRGADVQLAEPPSVPADDEQTHCALSGEPFEQFWDEGHQEWRYRDAVKLTAEEAARSVRTVTCLLLVQ